MKKAKIIGTGSYVPEKILTNRDLEKMVETSDDWIVSRTGIRERRIAKEDEYTSDMGYMAAKLAIEDAKLSCQEIDCILVATLTPDYVFPSTACLIQKKLGIENVPAVDLQAACSGYVYALAMAKAFVEQGMYKKVLIIAAEKLSSIVNYNDRGTCVLFGDGAAACVVGFASKGYTIQGVSLGADGGQSDLLILPAGGSRHPASHETVDKKMHYLCMEGNEVFKHAVRRMESASKECLELVGLQETDISWLIPHQANERIIDAIAKRFKHLPQERVYKKIVQYYGNTSASSVGIALDHLRKEGKIQNQENVLLTVFGAGLTRGAAILKCEEG
ncbi:MAG: beta-ketoacyl-ACP synthase III [Chlamydiota bacterium]